VLTGLDGKVALVTGAGRGLGRVEALELARQGVRVVVNDFGKGRHGEDEADSPAEEVVEEIRGLGGEAVADHGDVADFEAAKAMVHRGVEEWGSLDIVVNNAGFMRDRMIFSMTEDEFDSVVRVHLRGHFSTLHHATAYWREMAKAGDAVYGRIINTASESGIGQGVGQPNYGAAKAGIISMTVTVALAMAKYGITANAIAPRARTRLTEDNNAFASNPVAEDAEWDQLGPDNVSPLVAWLASPAAANVSGNLFVVWGKTVRVMEAPKIAMQMVADEPWTPESIGDAITPFFADRRPVADGFGIDLLSDYWRNGPS
jgi:NAD(P)-dependent dehydrogenase (short-subunit alcohol dehydrogenase family)